MSTFRKLTMLAVIATLALSSAYSAALAQAPLEPSPDVIPETPAAPLLGAAPGWKIYPMDNSEPLGDYASLVIVPQTFLRAIAYHKDSGGMKEARGPQNYYAGCNSIWYWCTSINYQDSMYIDYSYPVSGTWAIAYQRSNQPYVYSSVCYAPNCYGTYFPVDFQTGAVLGVANSITHDLSGNVHLAYTRSSPAPVELRYAKWVVSGGNCYGGAYDEFNCEIIDANIGGGGNTSIDTTFTGLPRIAYRGPSGELKLATKLTNNTGNCGPSNTWRCDVIDNSSDVGNYISLHIPKCFINCTDFMQIAYINKTSGIMRYAKYVASGGNCGPSGSWECTSITFTGWDAAGMGLSMEVRNAVPTIAYMDADDQSNNVLKVAKPVGSGGNCAFSTWECTVVDDGYRGYNNNVPIYNDVGRWASLALFPSGDASIAYQDSTDRSLVLIEQTHVMVLPYLRR